MPRRPPPRTPLESFFDRIVDNVLDHLEEVLEPHLDDIGSTVARVVKQQVQNQAQTQTQTPPPPRSRKRRSDRNPGGYHVPPPPPPPPPPRPAPPKPRQPTLYDDLQVNPTADPETIKAAYKALAGKYHPDNQTTGNAEKARRVIAAYEVLGDAAKRKAYDRNIGV